jgi:hypothetical protein
MNAETETRVRPIHHAGMNAETREQYEQVWDAIGILAGRQGREGNHVLCQEILYSGLYGLMKAAPESFATIFIGGYESDVDTRTNFARFRAFVKGLE